ncbi:MAG: hypothetical protein ACI38A_10160 [Candidatus Ornithomonoglobus sp.]
MLSDESREIIQYHIDEKMLIDIERNDIASEETIHGFPLMLSQKFLLMTVIYDFHDEGYCILNTEYITDAYSHESDAFREKICISEGLRDIPCPEFLKGLQNYRQILENLQGYNGFISIQCEKEQQKCNFFLGKINSAENDRVIFHCFGADGMWDDKYDEIMYNDITQITFGDNYSKMLYKYMNNQTL